MYNKMDPEKYAPLAQGIEQRFPEPRLRRFESSRGCQKSPARSETVQVIFYIEDSNLKRRERKVRWFSEPSDSERPKLTERGSAGRGSEAVGKSSRGCHEKRLNSNVC